MIQDDNSTESVYDVLLSEISEGTLEPGQWLREESLAVRLGTSRTPVREALRSLAAEGLVEVIRHRGARVRNWTHDQLVETYELRALLEGYAARRAAENTEPTHLAELERVHKKLEETLEARGPKYLDGVAELNSEFHRLVLESTGSPLLGGFISTLSSVSVVKRAFRGYSDTDLLRTVVQHGDIVLAIRTGNSQLAEAAMKSHIYAAMYSAASVLQRKT